MLGLGIFCLIEGLLGRAGIMFVNQKYQGHSWTKQYMKDASVTYLLGGISYTILGLLDDFGIYRRNIVVAILVAIPGFIVASKVDKKYRNMIE